MMKRVGGGYERHLFFPSSKIDSGIQYSYGDMLIGERYLKLS